jgi:hypothetical protein
VFHLDLQYDSIFGGYDTQHNDVQQNGLLCDAEHKSHSAEQLCIECHYAKRHYADCRISFIVMLNVVMLSVIMLNVVAPFLDVISVQTPNLLNI